jgi:hypothetical protein
MTTVEEILAEARNLSPEEQRQQALALLIEAERQKTERDNIQASLAIVEEMRGSIKGLDRDTIIWLAEDYELG